VFDLSADGKWVYYKMQHQETDTLFSQQNKKTNPVIW
jgi:hypothetical protein